jgi:hypothetical protein
MTSAREDLGPFRQTRLDLIKQYVGKKYAREGTRYEQIVNLMYQAADIYTMTLTANRPRVKVTSYNPELKGFASRFELAVNNYSKTMGIEQIMEGCVLDAFFSIGIAKVYLADSHVVQLDESTVVDPGKPWVKQISLDDFCFDTKVKRWDEVRFISDSYRVPFHKLREDSLYDQKVVRNLSPDNRHSYIGEGESTVASLTTGHEGVEDDEITPMINLVDVYLPFENKTVTWALDIQGTRWEGQDTPPLVVEDWDGPENPSPLVIGPYHILGFGDAPDNTMPVSPAINLSGLADLANSLFRKLERQARRQKTYHIFRGSAEKDAERQKKVSDGEFVRVEDPQAQQEVRVGGVDQGNLAFSEVVVDKFDRIGGNLPAMGGLGASADTVGQEKIISGQTSKREAKMQYRVVRFARGILTDIGHLMFYDPVLEIPGEFQVPGTNISVPAPWTPEMREGEFIHYNLEIEPYSMAYRAPSQRAQDIMAYMQNIVIPMLPAFQEQGGIADLQAFNEMMADLMNEPALLEILKFGGTPNNAQPVAGEPPPKAAHTIRENVRHSVAHGQTQQGASRNMVQNFMNQGSNPNQQGAPV